MAFIKSIGLLLLGVLKRLYYLIPSLFSDPFDVLERWFKVIYEPPQWLFWVLLSVGLAIAIILAYHEVRMQKVNLERQLDNKAKKKEIRKKLAEFLLEGNNLAVIDQSKEPPIQKVLDWVKRVANYLEENLGEDYMASFLDCHGLPMSFTRLASLPHVDMLSIP